MKNKNQRTVIEFDIVLKIIFIAILTPLFTGIFKLALKLAGIEYLTNRYIYQFLLKPSTIAAIVFCVLIFALTAAVEQQFVFAGIEAEHDKADLNYIIKNGLASITNMICPSNIVSLLIVGIETFVLNMVVVFHISVNAINIKKYIAYGMKNSIDLRFAAAGILLVFLLISVFAIYVPCIMYNEKCSFKAAFKKSISFAGADFFKILCRILLYNLILLLIIAAIYAAVILVVFLGIFLLDLHKLAGAIYMTTLKYLSIMINIMLVCVCIPVSFAYTHRMYVKYVNEPQGERIYPEKTKKTIAMTVVFVAVVTDVIFALLFFNSNAFVLADFMKIPGITAHRGYSIAYPENTMLAFEQAVNNLSDYIELDVRQTYDGGFVIMHDENLKRTTGVNALVGKMSQEKICNLYADYEFGRDCTYADKDKVKVPSIEDVFEFMEDKFVRLNIELKTSKTDRDYAERFYELLAEYDMLDKCVIMSSDYEILKDMKKIDDSIETGYILSVAVGNIYDMKYVDFFSVNYRFISTDMIYRLHSQGREIHVWTVNDEKLVERFMDMGVDNIITDDPLLVRQAVYAKDTPDIFRVVLDYVFGN